MEQSIIKLIDQKAESQYNQLTPSKIKSYRTMLYAGTQATLFGKRLSDISAEIMLSESTTRKLVQKWVRLMLHGDVTVNLIAEAIKKAKMANASADPADADATTASANPTKRTNPAKSHKNKKVLGFNITPEDEKMRRAAIRSSILFFQKFGRGCSPRLNGEYYAPGTHEDDGQKEDGKWLPLETAALYCGCSQERIADAAQLGTIERRAYRHSAGRNYYEYKVSDLDLFIKCHRLL